MRQDLVVHVYQLCAQTGRFQAPPKRLGAQTLRYKVYPGKSDLPPELHAAYMARRIRVAQDLWRLLGVRREDPAARARALLENFRFWGAPVGLIVTVDRGADRNAWGHTGMLLMSLALLAVHHGLATAMLEAWGNLGRCVYDALQIPMDREVVWRPDTLASFGHGCPLILNRSLPFYQYSMCGSISWPEVWPGAGLPRHLAAAERHGNRAAAAGGGVSLRQALKALTRGSPHGLSLKYARAS